MRTAFVCLTMTLGTLAMAGGDGSVDLRIRARDLQTLQRALLDLAQDRLRPLGVFIDTQHSWLSLSGPLPAETIEVRHAWTEARVPQSPLTFALVSGSHSILATLAVPLQRDVQVPVRRLRKGSAVTCADLAVQRRDIRHVPAQSLALPCDMDAGAVALRDIGAGEVLGRFDIGGAPDVSAGAPVTVSVAVGGINVSTMAIALADAKVGDQIDVRLPHPARTRKTRVTGPGTVQLEGAPL